MKIAVVLKGHPCLYHCSARTLKIKFQASPEDHRASTMRTGRVVTSYVRVQLAYNADGKMGYADRILMATC